MTATIDILIPTYRRPVALAVTLTSLVAQTCRDFRIVISDQTEDSHPVETGEVQAVLRVLRAHGHAIDIHKHLPRRGIAEQRQFLLEQAQGEYSLFLDDDLILEPDVVERMLIAIQEEGCGFVGCAFSGLSYIDDVRPDEQKIEFWDIPVEPEMVKSGTPQWERWRLHNGANIYHIQHRLGLNSDRQRKYRVTWIAACVMYDTTKLRAIDGFSFWRELPPEHCGEDVLVQLRLMARYGGCGLIPAGVYHQELPTTIVDRRVAADSALSWSSPAST
jgi:glycosyltransferase involved in cell wall biosynthesis